jgi:hypothetical protein
MIEVISVKHAYAIIILKILLVLVFSVIPSCGTKVFNYVVAVWDSLFGELFESGFENVIRLTNSL